MEVALTVLLIILLRIGDVSLGTIRTVAVINGRKTTAWVLGFFEVLIWIFAVGKVVGGAQENIYYAVAYALGFAFGNYVGLFIEQRVAMGERVIQCFTNTAGMAWSLRQQGYRVTVFTGEGRDGPVQMLYMKVKRRHVPKVLRLIRAVEPKALYVVEDVKEASNPDPVNKLPSLFRPTGWRAFSKRK
jgi:uncharacterized protein YebE (UPF0316 family)